MRLLIVSDSHGAVGALSQLIRLHSEADILLFLGDGASDLNAVLTGNERFKVVGVRGNNDRSGCFPDETEFFAGGKRIFCAHGHTYHVKYSELMFAEEARARGAAAAFFGHTHTPLVRYESGMYLANPGSLRQGCYALADIVGGAMHIGLAKL